MTIVGLGAGTFVAAGLLTLNEKRATEPLLLPRLFRNGVFVLSVLVISLAAMGMFAAAVFLPLYFQLVLPFGGWRSRRCSVRCHPDGTATGRS